MHVARRRASGLLRVPSRGSDGWVVLNLVIASTRADFCTELAAIHSRVVPELNEALAARKIFVAPFSLYKDLPKGYPQEVSIAAYRFAFTPDDEEVPDSPCSPGRDTKTLSALNVQYEPHGTTNVLLAERLRLIASSAPLFTAILGDRHGPSAGAAPESLQNHPTFGRPVSQSLVESFEESSVLALETLFGGVCTDETVPLYFIREGARCLGAPAGLLSVLSDDHTYVHADPEGQATLADLKRNGGGDSAVFSRKKAAWGQHQRLKAHVHCEEPSPLVLRRYPAAFDRVGSDGVVQLTGISGFVSEYKVRVLALIDALYPAAAAAPREEPQRPLDVPLREQAHANFLAGAPAILGRKNAVSKVELYVVSPNSRNALLVHGNQGVGVTRVLSATEERLRGRAAYDVASFYCGHAGLSEESRDLRTCLLSLCKQLLQTDLPQAVKEEVDPAAIVEYWKATLSAASCNLPEHKVLVLLVDAADRLEPPPDPPQVLFRTDTGLHLLEREPARSKTSFDGQAADSGRKPGSPAAASACSWIPVCLPKNVRLVVSCAEGSELAAELISRGHDSCEDLALSLPGAADVESMVAAHCAAEGIPCSKALLGALAGKADVRTPLYGRLAVTFLAQLHEVCPGTPLVAAARTIPGTLPDLVQRLLSHAENVAGRTVACQALSALAVCPDGLLLPQLREYVGGLHGVALLSGKQTVALLHALRPFVRPWLSDDNFAGSSERAEGDHPTHVMMPMNGTCQNMQLASPLFVRAVTQRYLQSDTED
ncbi:hypothetical protein DIPPA_25083 [Diplonema papillatum]|nr:hypothetical protein DIPPA_25083 [Diplonema papillatum]